MVTYYSNLQVATLNGVFLFWVVLLIGISSMLYFDPELKAVDEQTDDEIVHVSGLREADRRAHQAFAAGAQRQVLALQLLGMVFPHFMEHWIEMALVRAPAIRVKVPDPERRQQRLQREKHAVCSSPAGIG
jgi:hypothetical protein